MTILNCKHNQSRTEVSKLRPAMLSGHPLDGVSFSQNDTVDPSGQHRRVEVPSGRTARLKFLRAWARTQRRNMLSGGMVSLLILPAAAAQAQGDGVPSVEDIVEIAVQEDGSLLVTTSDGGVFRVAAGDYDVNAQGEYLIQADAMVPAEAATATASVAPVAVGLGAVALAGAAAAGGSGGGGGGGGGGGNAGTSTSGVVIDGYISGATVFGDANGNSVLDDGEASTTTDALGRFTLDVAPGTIIVSQGGTDVLTGLAFEGTLTAPAGSTVISPVTTLVARLVDGGATVDNALVQVRSALGLAADTDILNADPIADGDNALFAAGVKVANIISAGVANGATEANVIDALADAVGTAGAGETPLNDGGTITLVLNNALTAGGATGNSDTGSVGNSLANANNVIDARAGDIEGIADVQQVVQSDLADDIEDGEVTSDVSVEDIEDRADAALDVEDGAVIFDRSSIDADRNLADFGAEIEFAADSYTVADGVTFTLRMDQADGLTIGGAGTVVLEGDAAEADLSGISTSIDATAVDGFTARLDAGTADGFVIDLAPDATLEIDADFADLSAENPTLDPDIDISGITVDGDASPAGLLDVLDAGSFANTMKLVWNALDNAYYADFPDSAGNNFVNEAFVELGNAYVEYLNEGGAPLLDVVQTRTGGTPDFDARQQTLHDNLLGNVNDVAIAGRIIGGDLVGDPRSDAAKGFGDRPIFDGSTGDPDGLLATQVWDAANGIERADFTPGEGEIYVLNGNTLVDGDDAVDGTNPFDSMDAAIAAAGEGAYILVGPGTYTSGTLQISQSLTITGVGEVALQGRFRIDGEAGTEDDPVEVAISGIDVERNSELGTGEDYGFYVRGDDVVLDLHDVSVTDLQPDDTIYVRGVLSEIHSTPTVNITDSAFTDLQTGFYVHQAEVTIDGSTFTDNRASVAGVEGSDKVSITNSNFVDNSGLSIDARYDNGDITLSGNTYDFEAGNVKSYFARDMPAFLPEELDGVTAIQTANNIDGSDPVEDVFGTAGDDLIVDTSIANLIDISAGGTDLLLLTANTVAFEGEEGLNQVIGFTAGTGDGADKLLFRTDDLGEELPGLELQTLAEGGVLGANTGFVLFSTKVALTSDYEALRDGLATNEEVRAILDLVDSLDTSAAADDGTIIAAFTDDDEDRTLLVTVDLDTGDDGGPEPIRIEGIALLENVDGTTLSDENIYDFSSVQANT